MTGTCRQGRQEHKSSDPLALEQFLSAFLLLMAGILLAGKLIREGIAVNATPLAVIVRKNECSEKL